MDLKKKIAISFLTTVGILYLSFIFWIPAIFNSNYMCKKYEEFATKKAGFEIDIDGVQLKTNYDLSFTIKVDEISSLKDEIQIKNIKYKSRPFRITPRELTAEMISLDIQKFKPLLKPKNPDKKKKINVEALYLPLINIDNGFIKIDDKTNLIIDNIDSYKENSKIICQISGVLNLPQSKSPITIGKDGRITYGGFLEFENFSIEFANSKLYITGTPKSLNLRGKDLPADELESAFLYYYKSKYPLKRNFIENFEKFAGTIDADLNFSPDGINGKCKSHNLSADFSKFKIPVILPEVTYYFVKRKMNAKATGTFGGEPVYTDVEINGVATDNLHTIGNVKANLTNKFTQKYFPPLTITGNAEAYVKYEVNNRDVDIDYYLTVRKGNNLSSVHGGLDNLDKIRKIHAHTLKKGHLLKLTKYSYQFIDGLNKQTIFTGDGEFEQVNRKFHPIYLTFKTGSEVDISAIKSFIREFFTEGTINADLKYDFTKKHLLGSIVLNKIKRKNFLYLEHIKTDIYNDRINISSYGNFFSEPIKFMLDADNNFSNGIVINDINIDLKKFRVEKGNINTVKSAIETQKGKSIRKKRKNGYNITVKNGKIHVDEVVHSSFYLKNVNILGKMKDNIVDFTIPETDYAKGKLKAKGKYHVKKHSSDIYFSADDISSNTVVTNIFKLPDQFMGKADATLHLITKNKLNNIYADATFAIKDGYMPKLGSYEFILNKPDKLRKAAFWTKRQIKFTLEKITNIDFSKPNTVYSNLKGSFTIDNDNVKNIKIFSKSDYLSLFIEGDYNIDTQNGDINIWGRHNKFEEKNIKIYKIPLSLIYKLMFKAEYTKELHEDKIKLVPPIKAEPHEELIFRVNIKGKLNSKKLKFQFKDLRN